MARSKLQSLYFNSSPETTELCTLDSMPCPARIADDTVKKQLWDFIVADMEHRRVLSPTYTLLISELVETVVLIHKCREQLDKEGETIDIFNEKGSFMGQRLSPWFTIVSKQQPILIKLLEKIGMSPRDITFLVSPDAVPTENIQQINAECREITYFRT